jgi:hypothetical protein
MVYIYKNDGAIKHNEFILHHSPISFVHDKEVYKSISTARVTIEEYNEFENWVRDSISMEKIYHGCDIPYYRWKFLIRDKSIQDYNKGEPIKTYNADIHEVRRDVTFDRSHQLDYSNSWYTASLVDMYLPSPQRYMKMREFDKNRFIYEYTAIYEGFNTITIDSISSYFPSYVAIKTDLSRIIKKVPIIRAEYEFGKKSSRFRDYHSVLAMVGTKTLKDYPVCGIKGFQADAFCHWKSEQLQAIFNKKGLNYKVIVSLPTSDDAD